jgi:hypothetical protein
LEEHGKRMREAMKALGDDEEEELKETAAENQNEANLSVQESKRNEIQDTEMKESSS